MFVREHRWRPSSHVERKSFSRARWLQLAKPRLELSKESFNESTHVRVGWRMLVKRAVRTDAVAEGDVDVDMHGY
jgi:hypothetical protein